MTEGDLRFLLKVRNDESTRKNLENDSIFSIEECRNWYKNNKPNWFIIYNENGNKVGYLRTNGDEVGCDIHPNYRRRGYAKQAFLNYLKDKTHATLWVFEDNFAINLYEKLGFHKNGESKIIRERKYIKMIYNQKKQKSCYIINFYLGNRRRETEDLKNDRLFLLKKQIEYLYKIKNKIDTIFFNFNIRTEDYQYVSEIFKITPKFINGSEVLINFRENFGMSYGAYSDIFGKYKEKFDYYFFNEDDYFFVEDNWDDILIEKFNSLENCGYLCMVVMEGNYLCNFKKHAGHSSGVSSYQILKKVFDKYGELPHSKKTDYGSNEFFGQVEQTNVMIELGYDIYDIRDEYRFEFAFSEGEFDIWRFFWWNSKYIIKPDILLEDKNHTWWESFDEQFQLK